MVTPATSAHGKVLLLRIEPFPKVDLREFCRALLQGIRAAAPTLTIPEPTLFAILNVLSQHGSVGERLIQAHRMIEKGNGFRIATNPEGTMEISRIPNERPSLLIRMHGDSSFSVTLKFNTGGVLEPAEAFYRAVGIPSSQLPELTRDIIAARKGSA